LQIVGRIDVSRIEKYFSDIATDEVVFTDVQAVHVFERHPKAYGRYRERLTEILEAPDYIFC
jgi:hypothetical protein